MPAVCLLDQRSRLGRPERAAAGLWRLRYDPQLCWPRMPPRRLAAHSSPDAVHLQLPSRVADVRPQHKRQPSDDDPSTVLCGYSGGGGSSDAASSDGGYTPLSSLATVATDSLPLSNSAASVSGDDASTTPLFGKGTHYSRQA